MGLLCPLWPDVAVADGQLGPKNLRRRGLPLVNIWATPQARTDRPIDNPHRHLFRCLYLLYRTGIDALVPNSSEHLDFSAQQKNSSTLN